MSNVINFLESLGARPALSPIQFAAAVAEAGADSEQERALLARDPARLSELLEGRARIYCAIAMPDDQQDESAPDDRDGDGVPDQQEPAAS
jgi:hypothetical protein